MSSQSSEYNGGDKRKFLIEEVLANRSDTVSNEVQAVLDTISRASAELPIISVSYNSGSIISGADKTYEALGQYILDYGVQADILKGGWSGATNFDPVVTIKLPGKNCLFFRNIYPEKVESLLSSVLHSEIPADDFLGQEGKNKSGEWPGLVYLSDHPFMKFQKRWLLSEGEPYEPADIELYIANGGYKTLVKTLNSYTIEEVCDIIEKSGLRGRSGSGFPTGRKWKYAQASDSEVKYLVCNARESDPGAFTDKMLIEGQPHKLLEGMVIASYAMGASKAFIYTQNGADHTISVLKESIKQAYDYGLLGDNIFDSGFRLDIEVRVDPGAFVCGEETALVGSLEGRRGMPQVKPPFPSSSGLNNCPTIINNVETLMNVPLIMKNGPEWFSEAGTPGSKGTKVFWLSGKSALKGLIEVEMGTSLRSVIEDTGDGIAGGKELKALLIGGVSGYLLPEKKIDIAIDYEELKKAGAGMGSGGLLIIDENTCLIDLSRYQMEYMQNQSCGKCIPCREGTSRMFEILSAVVKKPPVESAMTTLERFKGVMQLENIAKVMKETSLCGLGQNAPNLFLSVLTDFRDELEEHIFDRRCRANRCHGLRTFVIDVDKCTGCTLCAEKCPVNAIYGTRLQPYFIVDEKCTGCGICYDVCKFDAVSVK
ncbi:MAG: NADH-ubiquinone oxidoreductase-F iron-sulfur binding region domain-containing protein [Bacteroidales bacterium]|nr:NADH-ubiquinone oxidoreductase-F iron-sulfur binding region domain-containing protein [Bacteroidales bacterium]